MNTLDLRSPPFVLLDDSRAPHEASQSLLFHSAERIISATSLSAVPEALEAIDQAYQDGLYLAGWIAYEVGAVFEEKLKAQIYRKPTEPLVWIMATRKRERLSQGAVERLFHDATRGNRRSAQIKLSDPVSTRPTYLDAIETIQAYIQAGDVYQVNHTFPLKVQVQGDALSLYQRLRENQPVPYGAYIDTGEEKILSFSPELFLEKSGNRLRAKPMKGTARRGKNDEEDIAASQFLKQDEKSRAENLMIVDLIRNDMSRVAEAGTVSVEALFDTERYPTLHQMTSTVTAKAATDLSPSGALAAMFPCGSITGAPKIRAMEIINELEPDARGVYCGAIGHFSPATPASPERWALNVPIRTLVLSPEQTAGENTGRLHIGSGIVADSDPAAEFDECVLKGAFVHSNRPDFSLIETLRLQEGRFPLLTEHLDRLVASASFFNYPFDRNSIECLLFDHAESCAANGSHRCRLLLDRYGASTVTSSPLSKEASFHGVKDLWLVAKGVAEGTVLMSDKTVDSTETFLRHKTTHRQLFNDGYKCAQHAGALDTLFFNEKDHLCEGAISSVFIISDGQLIVPPLADGLLSGILRSKILSELPNNKIVIRSIKRQELLAAEIILIGNAVRGLRRVTIENTNLNTPDSSKLRA